MQFDVHYNPGFNLFCQQASKPNTSAPNIMVKFSPAGCTFTYKTTMTLPQPTLSFIVCPHWPHLALNTSWLTFFSTPLPTHAGFLAAAHIGFLQPSPLPLTTVSLPYTPCSRWMNKRNMINIVNMCALLKEINDSRWEWSCLIAQLRACGQDVLREKENWDILFF